MHNIEESGLFLTIITFKTFKPIFILLLYNIICRLKSTPPVYPLVIYYTVGYVSRQECY